uniref:RING-type E3 ubiquitin transferase n=1 Tax=Echeneis naucrates TaxID=173247 RepID=A0A665U957_ECHNA
TERWTASGTQTISLISLEINKCFYFISRHFLNGSCRFGPRCNYRHEWPVIPSVQVCRYFQKGGCWYGERCSVPNVSSSRAACAPPDRRGSEPVLSQVELMSRRECSTSDVVADLADASNNPGQIIEEQSHAETMEDGAAAASSSTHGEVEEMDALLQSKNVTCGICMDKVYEKTDPRHHVFGILPNCNHSFCLQCIMTWRKTKDLGLDVVKTCPQCRARSAFYVPNKYWVEGQAKESVIAAFKEKCSKKSCSYYARHRCCPFKKECLYRHDKPRRRRSFPVNILYQQSATA